ncbi:unnamed protein product, partial [Staurois parvus]
MAAGPVAGYWLERHNNLASRKCMDMAFIRKFMGGARSSRFKRNQGTRQVY